MLRSASSVASLREGNVPADVGIERPDAFQERGEWKGFYDGSLQLGELAVTIYKVGERLAGVVNRLNAFLVFASLDLRVAEISLADAGDGSRGVHDFVGKHTGQLLPGFHFVSGYEAGNIALHVVECLLQGSFAWKQARSGEAEGVIAISYSLTHQKGTSLQPSLMAKEQIDEAAQDEADSTY